MNNQPKDHREMTQQEIADRLGMSRSRVNQCEKSALEKIRVVLEKRGIKASDFLEVK
jgi:DNA-directed RNA polymerase sigma subunit (sigma70/sigma32)